MTSRSGPHKPAWMLQPQLKPTLASRYARPVDQRVPPAITARYIARTFIGNQASYCPQRA
jgi:hypothetical protein